MILVVGLGHMGFALARRVGSRGHDVVAMDVDRSARRQWADTGRPAIADLGAAPWSEISRVLIVVRSPGQAVDVLARIKAEIRSAQTTCYVVTTLDADTAAELGEYNDESRRVIELPVSGGETAAEEGRLTAMAAGPVHGDDLDFVTETFAARTVVFESYGEPTLAKLINNVTGAFNALVAAEMLELGERMGLPPGRLYEVLLSSSGASWMAAALPTLRADLLAKDVELLARSHALPEVSLADPQSLADRLRSAAELISEP